tara:strand:+ start:577 stop:876 length:300 start_codon:yes stop_codon:yes gene_type:complete
MKRVRNINLINEIKKWFVNILHPKEAYKGREMKRIFQWRRYLDWKSLTTQEKLAAKRILLIPILAFPLLAMIRFYTPIIVTGLIVWFLYRLLEKKSLSK